MYNISLFIVMKLHTGPYFALRNNTGLFSMTVLWFVIAKELLDQ